MKKSELIIGVIIPLITTVLGVILGYYANRFKKTKPASLYVERVYMSKESLSKYGTWEIETRKDLINTWKQNFENNFSQLLLTTKVGEYLNGTDLKLHHKNPIRKNDIGHELYSINWKSSIDFTKVTITNDLKEKIRNSPNYYPNDSHIDPETFWKEAYISYVGTQIKRPVIHSVFRNKGEMSATIYGLKCVNVFSAGGGAGAGGEKLTPANDHLEIELNHKKNINSFLFDQPIVLDAGDTTILQFSPLVNDAAQGDGPGSLFYRVYVVYHDGISEQEQLLGTFEQADDVDNLLYMGEPIP